MKPTASQSPNIQQQRQKLDAFSLSQKQAFLEHRSVTDLVFERSQFIDEMLCKLWQDYEFDKIGGLSLIAVGGYGRAELHPLSDIDILILCKVELSPEHKDLIRNFITFMWDLHLEVGHSVRTLSECLDVGKEDLTVATNLQEARLICGCPVGYDNLIHAIAQEEFWPSELFFKAKVNEQKERHARFNNTAYNLEPDIKSSPGGLRDIHTLGWVARRHFGATSLKEMSYAGFLTDAEYRELLECQNFLWRIRFALHLELKRYDNRLTFSHQLQVAYSLGFTGEYNQPIEQMMKVFYRTLSRVSELNVMLLKLFDQAIFSQGQLPSPEIINDDFQRRGNYIEARKPALFQARPETILDMFLHIADDASIEGVSPPTLRQLRTARRRLNHFLHSIPQAREKFMALCAHPNALTTAFGLMHRLGVFSSYLPQWSQIVGQMQFDLFHVYTVDEHTMRMLKHLDSFNDPENKDKHPICCDVYPRLQKRNLLIIAAIFHDIAKGRGGDHSLLGCTEAYDFCIEHGLSTPEAKLVSWLVRHHLLMSVTAQRRDIYDPDVITEFATQVKDEEYLEHLVCLTVADICATNPDLWNSWKRSLLAELFYSTQRALRRGLEHPVDVRARIRHNQHMAAANLRKANFSSREIDHLWKRFKADYFLRHTHQQIAWHSVHLLKQKPEKPLVLLNKDVTRGGTEIFVYSQDKSNLFAMIAAELDRRSLTIHDAQIMISKDGYALDTFIVVDQNGEQIDEDRHHQIKKQLENILNGICKPSDRTRRPPRQLQHFKVKTKIEFVPMRTGKRSIMELVALDAPGLLAKIGQCFANHNLNLHGAKITTIGEKAEDFFILTSPEGGRLTPEEESLIMIDLKNVIDEELD